MRLKITEREEQLAKIRLKENKISPSSASQGNKKSSGTSGSMSMITNVVIVTVFAVFAWLVRSIVTNLNDEVS